MRTDHVNSTPTSSPPSLFFSDFITIFYMHMQKFPYLAFFSSLPVTGFWWLDSRDHSGVNTRITQFCGRSEILAGKLHWNSTGIHRNDQNSTGIGGALIRPQKLCSWWWVSITPGTPSYDFVSIRTKWPMRVECTWVYDQIFKGWCKLLVSAAQ